MVFSFLKRFHHPYLFYNKTKKSSEISELFSILDIDDRSGDFNQPALSMLGKIANAKSLLGSTDQLLKAES